MNLLTFFSNQFVLQSKVCSRRHSFICLESPRKLQPSIKTGAQWREGGEQWRDYFAREFCVEGMKVEDVGYKPEIQCWTRMDSMILRLGYSATSYNTCTTFTPSNIHFILPVTLNSDIQLLISAPLLSIIRQSKGPSQPSYSFPVISLHSISISSCVSIANQQCVWGGQRPSVSSTIAASNVFYSCVKEHIY